MPVKTLHPEYKEMIEKWTRCEDVADGEDTIKEKGASYLPKLSDQTAAEYDAYKKRATFFNAFWRTIVGLQGMLFRKAPVVTVPDSVKEMLDDISMDGTPLHIFALEVSEEALKLGRCGIFVDYPELLSITLADALKQNNRPLMRLYDAFAITNWKTRTVNNKTQLSLVVLSEEATKAVDEFEDECIEQYRVLDLIDIPIATGIQIIYRVRVYQIEKDPDTGTEIEVLKTTTYPTINGKHLDEIPFQFIGVDDVNWEVDEPPLIDLADLNLAHYRVSADYEHGCHFTGLPTPVISGYQPTKDGEKFLIGSMTAWVFPRPEATASYLEFKGEGLNALEKNLARKEAQMAILGARMLEVQRGNGVESANTAAIHRSGEQSMLASMGQAISIGLTKALKLFCSFAGADPKDVGIVLNKDFFPAPMDALTITALIAAWQNAAISYETLIENLQKGEIVDIQKTVEQEAAARSKNPPPLHQTSGTTPGNANATPHSASMAAGGKGANPSSTQMQNGTK